MYILLDFLHLVEVDKHDTISSLKQRAKDIYNIENLSLSRLNTILNDSQCIEDYNLSNYCNIDTIFHLKGGDRIFPNSSTVVSLTIGSGIFVVFTVISLLLLLVVIIHPDFKNKTTMCYNTPTSKFGFSTDGFDVPSNILSNQNIRFNCLSGGFLKYIRALDITRSPLLLLYGSALVYYISLWSTALVIFSARQVSGNGPNCDSTAVLFALGSSMCIFLFLLVVAKYWGFSLMREYSVIFLTFCLVILSYSLLKLLKPIINNYSNKDYNKINPYTEFKNVPKYTTLTFVFFYLFFWWNQFNRSVMLLFVIFISLLISYVIPMTFAYIANTSTAAISPCWKLT